MAVPHLPQQVRRQHLAAVAYRRHGRDELERRHCQVALPDAEVVSVAYRPGIADYFLLPLCVGNQAGRLPRQVHARRLAQAEGARVSGDPGLPQADEPLVRLATGQIVEVHVGRHGDAAVEV